MKFKECLQETANTSQFLTDSNEIKAWLNEMEIENYNIASDGKVSVKGPVYLYGKHLTSIPVQFDKVTGTFDCYKNKLTSLVGCPSKVDGDFDCSFNKLTSLAGCPSKVGGSFDCYKNKLTSLVGCPSAVGGSFCCSMNNLTSLVEISDLIESMNGTFIFNPYQIKRGGLELFLIKGIQRITVDDSKPFKIIKKYLGHPDRIFECQEELIENGFEEYAQL